MVQSICNLAGSIRILQELNLAVTENSAIEKQLYIPLGRISDRIEGNNFKMLVILKWCCVKCW